MSQEAAGCLSCSSGSITSTTQSAFEILKLCLGHPTNFWYTRDHHPKLHTNHLKVETTDQWCLHSFQDYSCMRFLETIVFLRHSWSFWNVNKLPCQRPEAVQHHLRVQGRFSTHGTTFTNMPMPQSTGNWSPSLSKGSSDVKWPITNCRCRWAPQKSGKGVLSHRRHIRKAPNCGDADVIVNIPGKPPVKSTRNGLMMTNYWWLMLYPHKIKVKFSDRFSGSIASCHHSSCWFPADLCSPQPPPGHPWRPRSTPQVSRKLPRPQGFLKIWCPVPKFIVESSSSFIFPIKIWPCGLIWGPIFWTHPFPDWLR